MISLPPQKKGASIYHQSGTNLDFVNTKEKVVLEKPNNILLDLGIKPSPPWLAVALVTTSTVASRYDSLFIWPTSCYPGLAALICKFKIS